MSDPMSRDEILSHAGRAIGKVDRDGTRGLTCLTMVETEALVLVAVAAGVPALKRDERINVRLIPTPQEETPDA